MNQHYSNAADLSRDFGAWAGNLADIQGVDEMSMLTRGWATFAHYGQPAERRRSSYPIEGDPCEIFGRPPKAAPPVIGD